MDLYILIIFALFHFTEVMLYETDCIVMQKKCALQDVKNLQVTGVGSAPASSVDELLNEISVCITSSKIFPHMASGLWISLNYVFI